MTAEIQETEVELAHQNEKSSRNYIVHILIAIVGMGPNLGMSTLVLQAPILVEYAPEGWNLPSYIGITLQFAILGPVSYALCVRFFPNLIKESRVIYALYILGISSAFTIAFTLRETVFINGSEYSFYFLLMNAFLSVIAFTSPVTFVPYMGKFKEGYLISYFLGEAFSGFLASILGFIQGTAGDAECRQMPTNSTSSEDPVYERYVSPPNFSPEVFYLIISGLMAFTAMSFVLLEILPSVKTEYAAAPIIKDKDSNAEYDERTNDSQDLEVTQTIFIGLLLLSFLCNFIGIGFLNSISTYAILPYGADGLKLSANISLFFNPISILVGFVLKNNKNLRLVIFLMIIGCISWTYTIIAAFMSPNPPFLGTLIGKIIIITFNSLPTGLLNYAKLSVSTIMRSRGGRSLMLNGLTSQIGIFSGSLVGFFVANFSNALTSTEKC